MSSHKRIIKQVQLQWTKENRGRLFENDNGQAWTGRCTDERFIDGKRVIELFRAYRISYGLEPGSSDLIGFEWVTICNKLECKEMPIYRTRKLPIICSVEVKTLSYSTIKPKQKDWLNFMVSIGGRAYIAKENNKGYDLIKWEG